MFWNIYGTVAASRGHYRLNGKQCLVMDGETTFCKNDSGNI